MGVQFVHRHRYVQNAKMDISLKVNFILLFKKDDKLYKCD